MWVLNDERLLFQIPKVQTFESQSQPDHPLPLLRGCCSRYQRYKLLRANHNCSILSPRHYWLFQIPKVQTFESQSQRLKHLHKKIRCCSRYQRYKLLRANHNQLLISFFECGVVPDTKGTNFWEPITTIIPFNDNSICCSRYQRYKLLRANHNAFRRKY